MATYDYSSNTDGVTLDLSTSESAPQTGPGVTPLNDTIIGSQGDDTIVAGPADQVEATWTTTTGGNNPHTIEHSVDVPDNDTIVEASGNNTLTAGYGNDTFAFNIDFHSILTKVDYNNGVEPTQTAGANTNGVWNSYVSNLNDWRAEMTALHGQDVNTSSETKDYTYGAKNQQSGSVTYDNSFSYETTHTNTSTNTITDYGNGHDSIVLAGITKELFDAHNGTVAYNGTDTTIHIGTFTIVVQGVQLNESDLTFQASAWV